MQLHSTVGASYRFDPGQHRLVIRTIRKGVDACGRGAGVRAKGQDGARPSLATHAYVSLLCLMATLPSACSFDESKLRASSSRTLDGAIDHSADPDAVQAGTGGAMEVGQVDSGATDQAPPTAGSDAALGHDGQDSSGANPDTALDGAIDYPAGATDQAPPTAGSDATLGQDGQDSSGANPDTALDGAIDDSAGATDQAPPTAGIDAALGQDGQDSSGANPDTNMDTNTGTGIVADGTYRVIARHSGKALDVYLSATADGSSVVQWTYNGGNNQRWTLTHLGGNVYKILGVQSGKALEVATTSTADDTTSGRTPEQPTSSGRSAPSAAATFD